MPREVISKKSCQKILRDVHADFLLAKFQNAPQEQRGHHSGKVCSKWCCGKLLLLDAAQDLTKRRGEQEHFSISFSGRLENKT